MIFSTPEVTNWWLGQGEQLGAYWAAMSSSLFAKAGEHITVLKESAAERRSALCEDDPNELVDDYFLLDRTLGVLSDYSRYWDVLLQAQFSESWTVIQDVQDALRTVLRFALVPNVALLRFVERQCGELEQIYPYNLFASVEVVHDSLECSICGKDMKGPDCPHIPGELYRGCVANGIVRDIREVQAVALVENPRDKRCVISYRDDSDHFKLVNYLRSLLIEDRLDPFRLRSVEKRMLEIPAHTFKAVGRNGPCPCGSGLKFKKCCLPKGHVERPHFDFIGAPGPLLSAEQIIALQNAGGSECTRVKSCNH